MRITKDLKERLIEEYYNAYREGDMPHFDPHQWEVVELVHRKMNRTMELLGVPDDLIAEIHQTALDRYER